MEHSKKNKTNSFLLILVLLSIAVGAVAPFVWNRFIDGQLGIITLVLAEVLLLTFILTSAHSLWKKSGSSQWKLKSDKKQMKVYTLKIPGEKLLKIKIVGRLKSIRLASILTLMRNPDSAEDVNMFDSHYIDDSMYPELVYYTFKQKVFPPFKVREYVVKSEFSQDPVSKEMKFNFVGVPDKLPINKRYHRVTKMHNKWRYTPLKNGEIEYEFIYDAEDPGGYFPYALANWLIPSMLPFAFAKMPKILDKEKYRNAVVDYVREVDQPEEMMI
ncbi:hypothetical protein ATO12_04960 [Aquimarina atlantica]|uniref:START domain-containing protein n=1 Tax=Aquimarina atlantica TaxID=1317122 RepID=A0A023BPQ8_9FLAO|nr:hypothetical protein [Aquimarina atlantica]EZH71971.1 hypothetical protein ATO12_04960 [Aquimarina atlantica]